MVSDITGLERLMQQVKVSKPEDVEKLQIKLNYFNDLLKQIEQAIQENKIKNARTMQLGKDEQGKNIVANIEEVESNMAMQEYIHKQQQRLRNPEMKVNNFFMQQVGAGELERTDSLTLQKKESILGKRPNTLSLEEELIKIKLEEEAWKEKSKSESCYQRIKRIKVRQEDFHKNFFNSTSFDPQPENVPDVKRCRPKIYVLEALVPELTKPLAQPH